MTDIDFSARAGLGLGSRARTPLVPANWSFPFGKAKGLVGLIVPALLLWTWHAASSRGLVAPQVLPAPAMVIETFLDLIDSGELAGNLWISFQRVAYGFGIGASAGLLTGIAMGLSQRTERWLRPSFLLLGIIPVIGWLPLLMMLLGIGEALKIVVIAKAALLPVALHTMNGIASVPNTYREVGRVYGFSPWQTLRRIVLPSTILPIFTGLRIGLTTAWISLVVVEMLASTEGVGYLLVWGRQLFQLDLMIAMMAVIGFIGFAMDKGLVLSEAALVKRFGGRSR
ncbi:ABC transporter permease [Iodidimonas sp. SYSU 1G8]|uniref:ABC transporter permease n=1 Tax=Iodidimonas sp. SYSU 1G8 TaxID=3133967 RepID=UPI0031FE502C